MDSIPHESKAIFYYYGLGLMVALFFVLRRKKSPTMTMRLSGNPRAANPKLKETVAPVVRMAPAERSLNVVFQWNGHSWDAYEVLGLPAGSSFEKVEVTFAQALREQNADSHPFLRAAYEAIKQVS